METRQLYHCAFDVCEKRLVDLCFICKENGQYYCDEICCERDLEQHQPREVITWQ